jgi:hypothetical protein
MTQAEDFIGTLYVIAASDSPLERQKEAVREVVARMLRESQQIFRGDQERVRSWITNLKLELTKQARQPRADRFADLLDHACTLVADWLRENPEVTC